VNDALTSCVDRVIAATGFTGVHGAGAERVLRGRAGCNACRQSWASALASKLASVTGRSDERLHAASAWRCSTGGALEGTREKKKVARSRFDFETPRFESVTRRRWADARAPGCRAGSLRE
jgi:hypothetical protein